MTPLGKLVIVVLFGWAGVHKFIAGKKVQGLIYLFTFGVGGIGWLLDIVLAVVAYANSTNSSGNGKGTVISASGVREEEIEVAGVTYYLDSVMSLANESYKWHKPPAENAGRRVYRYYFTNEPVELVPEPSNAHDPNAVMVMIAGRKVGYVPADDALRIKNLLRQSRIRNLSSFVHGGEYKDISPDGSEVYRDVGISIKLKIEYK